MAAKQIATHWLNHFTEHVYAGNVDGVVSSFQPDGWLRDILIFTWDNRSLEGHDKIRAYLRDTLTTPNIRDIKLDERPHVGPYLGLVTAADHGVGFGFTFQTDIAHGRGYIRLVQAQDSVEWRAISVSTVMMDLKGYEEERYELGVYGGHTLAWESVKNSRRDYVEEHAHVLIIGGGQAGLIVAARFKQMNLPAIVLERTARVGDVWRNRYPTLTLHTPRNQHQMLYQPYPSTWPRFTPKDKLADWFEQYAVTQDLVVWTNSQPLPQPKYDPLTKTWHVKVARDGKINELNPTHIVVATGTLGAPRIPTIEGRDDFKGTIFHNADFHGAKPFKGQKVVVVGAGNTSADICQNLVFHGAASVTMVQRSSSCVVSAASAHVGLDMRFPEGVPTEVADFKNESLPFGMVKKLLSQDEQNVWEDHKDMHEGLRKAGLKLNMGIDGAGLLSLVHQRLGGYWLDVGCSQLIIDGKVKVKQGVEIARLSSDLVHFTDGSTLEADVVILATGYENIRDTMRELFGDEVIDKTGPVYGLDEEGESRSSFRRSGHPGLWFAAGDFAYSRFYSKRLALELKAIQLGLIQP
ncbi:dimethylaniline monooxygenase [Pleurotus eryngii]|uniref:Dimethylaniline monooxygenase n=1 Tax=Pleurotus eryngii TaxID=5323 RepID=A0A9P5ZNP6_PLEER|nr:dimethylaniline monooxygenase [Pleurotus eryngii]